MRRSLPGILLLLAVTLPLAAQDLKSFEKRTTVKHLPNGLTLVIAERREAPVFSFFTLVDVGAVQERPGITGLAHMFEHMAFKGTDKIGTRNYAAEKAALARVEQAYAAYNAERHQEVGRDEKKVAELEKAWKEAAEKANQFAQSNQFDEIIEREGAEGVNAFTDWDETGYFYSMPANRLELWAYLESERFLHPVMREFYKERDVVYEERRMRTDSRPFGRLLEQFLAAAFIAHPYHRPVVGWPSDLTSFSATDAQRFYHQFYVPANMTVTVVGDVKTAEALPILEKYFSRLPAGPKPPPLVTTEPPQTAERVVIMRETSQPYYLEGYHRPSYRDPDDPVYDAISDLLSNGRTSRLYRSLVRDKKIAPFVQGVANFPGNKYPHLFVFFAVSTPGHKPQEIGDAVHAELERLKKEDVTDDELRMVKTRAKASLIRGLADNEGLAFQLGIYQARFGDWRELFRQVDRIDKVSKADIRRVAAKTFVPTNRTVGIIENAAAGEAAKGGGQ